MELSVIIVNYNVKHFLEQSLISVKKALKGIDGEIIVVDNNSVDGSIDLINQKWHKINSTPGVSKIICFNSKPKAISADFMEAMFLRCNNFGIINSKNSFQKGDKVEMVNGPFINLILEIEKIESDKRIWILFDLMGKSKKLLTESKKLQKTNYN